MVVERRNCGSADEFMRAALVTNLSNCASAIVTANEVVRSISASQTLWRQCVGPISVAGGSMKTMISCVIVGTALMASLAGAQNLRQMPLPDLGGAIGWLNSAPLSDKALRGKVVLIDFWTYTCINSIRPLPYVKGWAEKYKTAGLVVVGIHTPEFSFEKKRVNVENMTRNFGITYPVAIDSNYGIWRAFNNEYWPAQYLADGKGRIRFQHFGEGDYAEIERIIQMLLRENGATGRDASVLNPPTPGIEAAPDFGDSRSPETYVGYRQAQNFASSERLAKDSGRVYSVPAGFSLNHWGLVGSWNVNAESAMLQAAPGKIVFRFHSRDLHFVLAPSKDGKPIRFRVTLDGAAPEDNAGADTAPDGTGVVREPRLYQLIRQKGPIVDRTFEIEFLDPGIYALDFTFG
jgi:thiol-disulfide isomerase/thioredoxin